MKVVKLYTISTKSDCLKWVVTKAQEINWVRFSSATRKLVGLKMTSHEGCGRGWG